jgi:hypothetical protein
MSKIECLKNYKLGKELGSGTAGIVFELTEREGSVQKVLKCEIIEDERSWDTSIELIKRFSMVGLGIKYFGHCSMRASKLDNNIHGQRFGFTIMEKISVLNDLLDGKKLSKAILDSIADQLVESINIMDKNRISHSDLLFQNIGYVMKNGKIKLRFFDFDKGSAVRNYRDVNILGIGRNLYRSHKLNDNFQYLQTNLWPRLCKMFKSPYLRNNPPMDEDTLEMRWRKIYKRTNKTDHVKVKHQNVLCGAITKTGKACANYKFSCRWHKPPI